MDLPGSQDLARLLGVTLTTEEWKALDTALETGVRTGEERGTALLRSNLP